MVSMCGQSVLGHPVRGSFHILSDDFSCPDQGCLSIPDYCISFYFTYHV